MKNIIRTGLLVFPLFLAACGSDQTGETSLTEEMHDANKKTVEEAQQVNDDKDSLESSCTDFVTQAAHDGMMEVEMGKVASERATNKEVKVFAQRMMADHGAANAELKALAQKKNITLPTEIEHKEVEQITKSGRDAEQVIYNAKGIEFDKAYMDRMVDDHKKAVDLFEDASKHCDDAEIKSFASQKLDVLKKHLETAETIRDLLKKTK
jgi:putative membrane protein